MKKSLLTILFIIPFFLYAQIDTVEWCPSGATWIYGKSTLGGMISYKFQYDKDTVIGNHLSKKINVYTAIKNDFLDWTEYSYFLSFYFENIGDTIYYLKDGNWVFLYDFSATVNDVWMVKAYDLACNDSIISDSIIVSQIDTVNLKNRDYLRFKTDTLGGFYYQGALLKNIGALECIFPEPVFDNCDIFVDDSGTFSYLGLTCYKDDKRGSVIGNDSLCEGVKTSIDKPIFIDEPIIYPNPSKRDFTIEIEGLKEISLYNMAGALVETFYTNKIDVSNLSKGTYFAIITTDKGKIVRNFIKN